MTEQLELLNTIIEQSLYTVFLPIFLKIILAAVVPAIVGLVALAMLKKMILPKMIKIIIGITVRIIAVIIIIMSTTNAIKNIKLPEIPEFQIPKIFQHKCQNLQRVGKTHFQHQSSQGRNKKPTGWLLSRRLDK